MKAIADGENAPEPDAGLDGLASDLAQRGLTTPAIVLLELLKPVSFLGSQLWVVLEPVLGPLWGNAGQRYARLLEDRRNIQRLQNLLANPARAGEGAEEEERCHPSAS